MNNGEGDQQQRTLKTLISYALGAIRGRVVFIVTCSVVITAVIFVYYPATFGDAIIRFERGVKRIEFIVPKSFEACELTFKDEMRVNSYIIGLYVDASGRIKPGGEHQIVEQKLRVVEVKNLIDPPKRTASSDTKSIKIIVALHAPSPSELFSPELTGLSIDNKKVGLRSFFDKNLLHPKATYVGRQYVREYVSYFLLLYNDEVSNLLLALLCVSLIPISLPLVEELRNLSSRKRFENHIKKKFSLFSELSDRKIEDAKITYAENFSRKDGWFRFLQVFGPAFGFTLTISSLIAGLHPSLREIQNIGKFFETIQIAMVSTLLGLVLRIIAILRQRVNNKLFIRADELFFDLTKPEESEMQEDAKDGH